MKIAQAEPLVGAVTRNSAGLGFTIEDEHVLDAALSQLDGARKPGGPAAPD